MVCWVLFMVNISTRSWGMIITMTPSVGKHDLARFFDDLRMTHLQDSRGFFGALFDLSAMGPLHPDLRDPMLSSFRLLLQRGMIRSAMAATNALLVSQLRRLTTATDCDPGARFLDASLSDWRKEAEAWAAFGAEPQGLFESGGAPSPE